jgi:Uncharacterized protein conserved in bacteria
MEARIVERGPILLVGMGFFGNPFSEASAWDEENEVGSLWKRFYSFLESSPEAIADRVEPSMVGYELHISSPETRKTGRYEVFVGLEVRSLVSVPVVCSAKILPATEYLVATLRGEDIGGAGIGRLYSEIAPGLGRRPEESYSFELYDERFKGMDRLAESEIDYYVPLLRQGASDAER